MGMTEADLPDEMEGFFPLGSGFARKADDQVGGDVDVGYLPAQVFCQRRKFAGLAAPRHAFENAVRPALQGQMQVRHEPGAGEQVDKHSGNIPGLQRAEPQAGDGGLVQHFLDERAEVGAVVAAIPAQMYAGQHGFLNAFSVQSIDFIDDVGRVPAALFPTGHGYDAIGAAVAATVLHLDEGAVPAQAEESGFAGLGGLRGHGVQCQSLFRDFNQAVFVGIADDQVDAQRFGFGLIEGGITAAEYQFGAGIFAGGLAQEVAGFTDRILGYGAGIEHQ